MSEISSQPEIITKDLYQANRLVSKLGLNEVKIDCCLNGCMLYYKNNAALTHCKFCREPKFKPKRRGSLTYKDILHQKIHYLPLIPRLKMLYASIISASYMRWYFENWRIDGVMTHLSHSEARQYFDWTYPDFTSDPHNIMLGLCANGFSPKQLI